VLPVIDFIAELAGQMPFARQAALEVGFLDMLLHIYVVFGTVYSGHTEKRAGQSKLLSACRSTLHILSPDTSHTDIVCKHPIYDLWLRDDKLVLSDIDSVPEEYLQNRYNAWRQAGAQPAMCRLMVIWCTTPIPDAEFQACIDIVEFSR
jgi:hypothetical protein